MSVKHFAATTIVLLLIGLFALATNINSASSSVPWWNLDFNHRVSLTVSAGSLQRTDYPLTGLVDFSKYTSVKVDQASIRVIDPNGNEIPSQTQWFSDTSANIYFRCSIPAGQQKTYYIYFATGTTMTKPTYSTDLHLYSGTTKNVENSKYAVSWDNITNARDIRIKQYSPTVDVHKNVDDLHHSLFWVNYEYPIWWWTEWGSTTQDGSSPSTVTVVASGPEIVILSILQQRSGHGEHKSMNLYFYPQQAYFVVEDTTVLSSRVYSSDVEWSYMIDCGSSPTSYADTSGNYYTAENPSRYGLGLAWLTKDAHLQWKGFSGIGDLSGELRWVLPADETSISSHYSKYAILLDGANIRADTQSLYSQLSNPPSLGLSQTAETQSVSLTLTSSINSLETAVNQQSSFEITLQNNGNIEAKNIQMSSYGVPSAWVQFSDDGFSLAPNAQKIVTVTVSPAYVGDGTYSLTISATAAAGNTPSAAIQLKVNRSPIAEFTFIPPNASIRDIVNFTDESSSPDGQVTAWSWTFGDGANSTLKNPSHKYAQKGNFAATLMVTDDNGAKASASHTVVIHNLSPSAAFNCTPTSPEVNTNAQFTDSSTDPENLLASWHWNFGDSSTSDIQNPSHNFTSTGNFNVTLTVTDDEGATDTSSKIVSVTGPSPIETPLPIPIWAIALGTLLIVGMGASIFYLHKRRP